MSCSRLCSAWCAGRAIGPPPAGAIRWSGKLEGGAEIGQRRIAFIQRCSHAGQQDACGMFPRIGLDGLERILLCLGELSQLEGHVRQGHENGR